ncbi:hypothetical protein HDF09_004133 [Edaphobacter lichenicola]|uniref:Uncharacterized protein n=1 Tax=Tunturiibacter empetritectus TaxID=3069691 RepID=A0A7W8IMX2_9BACT|nr:hypothetical protein [Edaphobacter lichenicola]
MGLRRKTKHHRMSARQDIIMAMDFNALTLYNSNVSREQGINESAYKDTAAP